MMSRHTYIQTYMLFTNENILKCVRRSNSLGPSIIQKFLLFFLWHFSALHTNGKRCSQEGSRPCYSQSQVVHAYHVLSLSLQGLTKVPFFGSFWPDMKTRMSVVIYMYFKKISPTMLIPNIYGFMGLTLWVQLFLV